MITREIPSALTSDPLWYKDAIIYQLHVKAFSDANDDGIGDFRGLIGRLDYIQDLGVNTIWLLPFYPSPMRDDGYDIADYRDVHPDYGALRDFRKFVHEAHRRGIRVITELVINHTSDQHPWFQAARKAPPGSRKREYYVWSDTVLKFQETRIIFTDTESSNWQWDEEAGAYYWHRFFSHQPDLNHNNPEVVKAIIRVMRFWLDMGVDGLRLDAIPYLCVREGTTNENLPETHEVIRQMRAVVDDQYQDRMFLAEANQWPEDVRDYFGDGDECHMAYHFPLMPRMYMAIAQEDRHPITEIMAQTPDIPESCQWAIFLRNHDELTLEMVTDRERDYMYQTFAADPRMRINVGIRRRLATLMNNDPDMIKLMNSLLLSMPGSPIIYYGDEIAMGDNIYLGDRNAVRTPMQWSPDRNAGFSRTDPQRLYLPPIMDPLYGYESVNVESQGRSPASLLNWMKRLIAVRKAHQSFGRGKLEFLRPGNRKIIAYVREYEDESILCVANLSRWSQPVELDLSRFRGRIPVELMGNTAFPPIGDLPYLLTLPGHIFYWFRLAEEAEIPAWHKEMLAPLELPLLVLFAGWQSLFPERVERARVKMAERLRRQFEQEILPKCMSEQRWFAAKGEAIDSITIAQAAEWPEESRHWLLAWVEVCCHEGERQRYFLPLAIAWEELGEEHLHTLMPKAMARVRQRSRMGVLYDAMGDTAFVNRLILAMADEAQLPFNKGRLQFMHTRAFADLTRDYIPGPIEPPPAEGSNSTLILGDKLFLKAYRHLQEGINPELEMGRFLTDISPYPNIVPLAGALQYHGPDETVITLALLQGFVENQGDAWSYTVDYLERFFADALLSGLIDTGEENGTLHGGYLLQIETLGRRTGELHQALARPNGEPDFTPEPITGADLSVWSKLVGQELRQSLKQLQRALVHLPAPLCETAGQLLEGKQRLLDWCTSQLPSTIKASKTRYHGDYHLGQVLLVENDFIIIDFEGEPARPLSQRRIKHSPLRDVAGMLRSFNYAAEFALNEATADRPLDLPRLRPLAERWEQATREAFMNGYRKEVAGCPSYPADEADAEALIGLFTLEKALYELRYELQNRPEWIDVPLSGLLGFLGTLTENGDA